MKPGFPDFAASTRVAGASVSRAMAMELAEPTGSLMPSDVAMVGILRVLDRLRGGHLTATDRAFVLGAHSVFAELVQVCEKLLSAQPAPTTGSLPVSRPGSAPATTTVVSGRPEPGSRAARPRRSKPNDTSSVK